jgi:hypothetical protein
MLALVGAALVAGCGAEYAEYSPDETPLYESVDEAVAACAGDDLQYDFNAFAASLAVATATELGRWDAASDFKVVSGKLALTSVGLLRCNGACPNVTALLQLQDDVTSGVPYHSPLEYRTRLVTWYNAQVAKQTEAATAGKLPPGTYRIKSRFSGDFVAVDGGSMASGALVEMWDAVPQAGADQWTAQVDGNKHKFVNVKSGQCLSLVSDSSANGVRLGQKPCAANDSQRFTLGQVSPGYSSIITRYNKAMDMENWGQGNETKVSQFDQFPLNGNQQWQFVPVNGAAPSGVPKGLYTLTVALSSKKVAVVGNLEENAPVKQMSYPNGDDHNNWYITTIGSKYQLVNRGSSKCLALASDSATAKLVQQTCSSTATTQQFNILPITNSPSFQIQSKFGKPIEVPGYNTADNIQLGQAADTSVTTQTRQFNLTPLLGGEPHKLVFSHTTNDAPCGDYKWFTITQPNGLPLNKPAETYLQLIFAGGRQTLSGADINPFIAQQSSGTLFAIDPSGWMNGSSAGNSGSCYETDILFDLTKSSAGQCCIRYNGAVGSLRVSSWSTFTFLCQ